MIDPTGKAVASRIVKEDVRFGYDLPKDAFRQPYMAKYLTVELSVKEMAPFSWDSFALIQGKRKLLKEVFWLNQQQMKWKTNLFK